MSFELDSIARLKSLTIWEDAAIDYDCVAVLFKVRLSLANLIGILAQMAMHYETH